ncbi:MAG: hypothetical protein ACXWZF_11290 [Actinomycetota bacterium]
MRKRIVVSVVIGAMLIVGGLLAPAQASRQARSNTGITAATSKARPATETATRAPKPKLKVFNTPTLAFTSKTCVINLSAIPDDTVVNSVSGCGVEVHFSVPMAKRTVPVGWSTWGSPPNTESSTPEVLFTQGATEVVLTYSVRGRRVGVEAEPEPFGVFPIRATFRRGNGTKIGKISRNPDGDAGALLYAGMVRSKKKVDRVKTLTLVSPEDFAIAQIRVS